MIMNNQILVNESLGHICYLHIPQMNWLTILFGRFYDPVEEHDNQPRGEPGTVDARGWRSHHGLTASKGLS